MDFELPEPIQVESKIGERLILVRPSAKANEFVTIDFEWRRWQMGNHPLKILNAVSTPYKSRNWKMRMVADAIRGLLAAHKEGAQGEVLAAKDQDSIPGQQPYFFMEESPADSEPVSGSTVTPAALPDALPAEPIPGPIITYAWKRLGDGQISQDINAPTPEALFQQAGFHPYRVLDPIQGFLCVPVQWRYGRWKEIPESS